MNEFVILTDSAADLPHHLVTQLGVEVLPLSFHMGGQTYRDWPDHREMKPEQFYKRMRDGEMATTAAVNVEEFAAAARPHLQQGKDVLILAFSSGLSATYQSAAMAAEELQEEFPQRTVRAVDTLCASLGQGMLVYLAARERAAGKGLTEVEAFVEQTKLRVCHWFTVDDLSYLKRGGRVSAATALMGTMLSIKPVMHMDDEGHLVNMAKVRGRQAALKALVDHMEETALEPEKQTIFISHCDCPQDARRIAEEVERRFGITDIIINDVGPVIGAHSGPGTVALFFLGSRR